MSGSSLYRVVEKSESRLVLRGQRLGLWILTLFLLSNAAVLLWVGLFVMSRRQLFPVVAGSVLGAFFAFCGLGALVKTLCYRAKIEVDGRSRVVRFLSGSPPVTTEVPFDEIAEVRLETRRRGRGRAPEHQVFLVDATAGERLIDRSTDGRRMEALAAEVRRRTGDPGGIRPAAGAPRPHRREGPVPVTRTAGGPPAGVRIESAGAATTYRWRTLPRSPFWLPFWSFLTLLLGGLAVAALAAAVIDMSRRPAGMVVAFLLLAALAVGLMYLAYRRSRRPGTASMGIAVVAVILANLLLGSVPFIGLAVAAAVVGWVASLCAFVLLARCRLRLSPAGLEYEERVLGLPLAWRRQALAAGEVTGLRIKAAVRGDRKSVV